MAERKLALAAVTETPHALGDRSEELRSDKEVALAAVKEDGSLTLTLTLTLIGGCPYSC